MCGCAVAKESSRMSNLVDRSEAEADICDLGQADRSLICLAHIQDFAVGRLCFDWIHCGRKSVGDKSSR